MNNQSMPRWLRETLDSGIRRTTKNDSTIIQCAECDNQVRVGQFTEQELREDGWLLEPVVYCPVCGPDDER